MQSTLVNVLEGQFTNQRILVLIPDRTRSLVNVLHDAKQLDFIVALGTHPLLSEESLNKLVGITAEERTTTFGHVGLLNHARDKPSALTSLQDEIKQIAGNNCHSSLRNEVDIRINKAVLAHSTHLRGSGVIENGIEKPNVRVTLTSKILTEDCARLNLGYLDSSKVNVDEWKDRR